MAYATFNKPSLYFNTKLYTGNGSTQSITGVGFQPDWVWIKCRDTTNRWHFLFDSNRGANKRLVTNGNYVESTTTSLTAFDSDGFSLANQTNVNDSGENIVSWNWRANAGTTSSNSDGSITSTVQVNTNAGFSIVQWTGNGSAGATVGHGLGATPSMIIVKITSSTGDWLVYHHKNTSSPETDFLRLSTDAATQDESTVWNDQAPTNQVFYLGSESTVNGNGNNFIAYCFAEKTGYSKFGSYKGNGNADGTFVYLGFKPAWIMTKKTNNTSNWTLLDNKRLGYNVDNNRIYPNLSDAENTSDVMDILSNGFKMRTTGSDNNTSGATYIYMAFAEEPLVANVGANGIPATAR